MKRLSYWWGILFVLLGGILSVRTAYPQSFALRVLPGGSFPLGSSSDMYSFGVSTRLVGSYDLRSAPYLHTDGAIGYMFLPTLADSGLSVFSVGVGIGPHFDLMKQLSISLTGSCGYSMGLYEGKWGGSPSVTADLDANYSLTRFLNLDLGTSFIYHISVPTPLYTGLEVHMGITVLPALFRTQPKLEIRDIQLDPIFPVFYTHYDTNPVGQATLVNLETKATENIKTTFFIPQFMDKPKLCAEIERLKPREEYQIDLYALLSDEVLSVLEDTKVMAQINVTYELLGATRTVEKNEAIVLHDRNAMTWDDDRKAAAFVTAKDPTVLRFAKGISGMVRDHQNQVVNLDFRIAMGLFQGLGIYGLSYVVDPKTPYTSLSSQTSAVDYLQFPRQTFEYRAGDCDDMSILYSALLSSVGIETAFITVPGHIYMAFAIGMDAREAKSTFAREDDLIILEDTVWIPVEVTLVKEGFCKAWQEGAQQWREHGERARLYPMSDSWVLYAPVGLREQEASIVYPSDQNVLASYTSELSSFVQSEIAPRVEWLREEIHRTNADPQFVNKLGVLYARFGLLDEAEAQFEQILKHKEYLSALLNLGNIAYIRSDMSRAQSYYERAQAAAPYNPRVLLALARVMYERDDYASASETFRRLEKLDPELAARFSYLSAKTDEAARASSADMRERIVWSE
jgi:hypothetical protein